MSEQKVAANRISDPMAAVFGDQQTRNLPAVVGGQGFNPDAFHAMQARDDALIADQILHGYNGKEFVYSFEIQGKKVTGISVVGARQLASAYGGIKARIVASVDKTGSLFVFKSFEPMDVRVQQIPQLSEEQDFYEVVMEVTDLKSGNSIMVRKKETKKEQRRDKTWYDRPHYDVIAESKAFRNGVLSILPQDVIAKFEERALQVGNVSQEKTLQQYREGALSFAARNGIAIDRHVLEDLTYAQIMGLGNATKDMGQFKDALLALGLVQAATRIEAGTAGQDAPKGKATTEKKTEEKREPPPPTDNTQTPAADEKKDPIPTTSGTQDVQTENPDPTAKPAAPAARRNKPLSFGE